VRVVQQPIEHRSRQCLVVGKGRGPLRKWQVEVEVEVDPIPRTGNSLILKPMNS
jgi:hypothetical protein